MTTMRRRPILEEQRTAIARVEQAAAQSTWVFGRVLVEGVGETMIDIDFPVVYSNRPLPFFGNEMDIGDSPEFEYFPSVTAIISRWKRTYQGESERYSGATIAVKTTGPLTLVGRRPQRIYLSYAFNGVALTTVNP